MIGKRSVSVCSGHELANTLYSNGTRAWISTLTRTYRVGTRPVLLKIKIDNDYDTGRPCDTFSWTFFPIYQSDSLMDIKPCVALLTPFLNACFMRHEVNEAVAPRTS